MSFDTKRSRVLNMAIFLYSYALVINSNRLASLLENVAILNYNRLAVSADWLRINIRNLKHKIIIHSLFKIKYSNNFSLTEILRRSWRLSHGRHLWWIAHGGERSYYLHLLKQQRGTCLRDRDVWFSCEQFCRWFDSVC